jgi:MFS family permease
VTESPPVTRRSAAAWWQRTAGGLPRPFWFLWAGQLVNRLGYFVEPFLALYLVRGRDLSATTAGALVAAFGLGAFASQIVGGWLADRAGRRITLVVGMVATAGALLGLGAARDLVSLAVFAMLAGVAIDLYRPAVAALVADLVAPADRPRTFALLYWAINLGVSIAAVLGGALAERGYWLLFVIDAATCLAFAALIARGVPETGAGAWRSWRLLHRAARPSAANVDRCDRRRRHRIHAVLRHTAAGHHRRRARSISLWCRLRRQRAAAAILALGPAIDRRRAAMARASRATPP